MSKMIKIQTIVASLTLVSCSNGITTDEYTVYINRHGENVSLEIADNEHIDSTLVEIGTNSGAYIDIVWIDDNNIFINSEDTYKVVKSSFNIIEVDDLDLDKYLYKNEDGYNEYVKGTKCIIIGVPLNYAESCQ